MEFHKSLYKKSFESNSPKCKMANLKNGRKRRNERFHENRLMYLSPVQGEDNNELLKRDDLTPSRISIKDKENAKATIVKSRQEAFVARFIAWKKKKEIEKNQKVQKRPPFIAACSKNVLFSQNQKSFAPENHKFKPPANLIIPSDSENCRYIIRNLEKTDKQKVDVQGCVLPKEKNFIAINKNLCGTPKLVKKEVCDTNSEKLNSKKKAVTLDSEKKTKFEYGVRNNVPSVKSKIRFGSKNIEIQLEKNKIIRSIEKSKPTIVVEEFSGLTKENIVNNVRKTNLPKTTTNKLSSLPSSDLKKKSDDLNKKQRKGNLLLKKKSVVIKSPIRTEKEIKKPFLVQKTPGKNPTYLKSGIGNNAKNTNSNVNLKSKQKSNQEIKEKKRNIQPSKLIFFEKPEIVLCQETPVESGEKLNSSFITSTQRKTSVNSGTILPTDIDKANVSIIKPENVNANIKSSLPLVNLFQEQHIKIENKKENEVFATPFDTSKPDILNKTPPNLNYEKDPIIYTSPYVTISRGKRSGGKEKELRKSLYISEETKNGIVSLELRRTKETTRYFRKRLSEEIDRLHNRCDEWSEYVKNADPVILEDCGNDMINVAIGQTKLLINKKFNQFKNLIEQCDQFAELKYNLKKNSDETLKPILPEDLEGFWQMMYIQVDDIDKRFHKLECWKSNNWKDPEELQIPDEKQIKKKNSKLLTKVSKRKSQVSNPNLRKYLKEMYKACVQNKKEEQLKESNDIVIMEPHKSSNKPSILNNNADATPLRRSRRISSLKEITVEPATPTRKSVRLENAPNNVSKSIISTTPGTPKNGLRLISLIKTPCIGCPGSATCSPKPNKSILKTPGTQKRRQTVIFNEQLQFKSPDKSFDSGKIKRRRSSSAKQLLTNSSDKKGRRKSLNLRARRLVLDPEAKIEIPKKKY